LGRCPLFALRALLLGYWPEGVIISYAVIMAFGVIGCVARWLALRALVALRALLGY